MEKNNYMERFDYRKVFALAGAVFFANILAMVNLSILGVKIHFFQIMIFLAAIAYGPFGGVLAGGLGSIYTAVNLYNPYIIVGNILLGFFTGFMLKKGLNIYLSVIIAFAVQIPWLYTTDVYLMGMQSSAVGKIIFALLLSNILWAHIAGLVNKYGMAKFQRI